jgi:hypothetical protein
MAHSSFIIQLETGPADARVRASVHLARVYGSVESITGASDIGGTEESSPTFAGSSDRRSARAFCNPDVVTGSGRWCDDHRPLTSTHSAPCSIARAHSGSRRFNNSSTPLCYGIPCIRGSKASLGA